MGNYILGGASLYFKHKEETERIRNMRDINAQELAIKRIIAENNYKIEYQKVMRLIKLDEYEYQKVIKYLEVERRKNDQLDAREKKRIQNQHEENMKGLNNEELKICNEFKQVIRKLDDDKEINTLKENNRFINEKDKMKLDYEAQMKHLENEELDIVNKRRNEKIRDEQEYLNKNKELENNHEISMEEIFRKRHKDEIENERLTQEFALKDKREKEKIHNDYLIKDKELEDKYAIRTKEINNDFIIKNKELKREEKKDKYNFVLKKTEIEEKGKQDERHFQTQMEEMKNNHKLTLQANEIAAKKSEIDINHKHEKEMNELHKLNKQMEFQNQESLKKLDNDKEIEIKKIETKSEERIKELDLQKSEMDHKYDLQKQQNAQEFQIKMGMISMGFFQYNLMNQNNKNEKPSEENNKSQNVPVFSNMFGMPMPMMGMYMNMNQNNKMPMMDMNNMFGFPMMNMMNDNKK